MTPRTGNFVAYYRVSRRRQAASGLGLEAQKKMVEEWLDGGNWNLVGEFTETESGKRTIDRRRPELRSALECCKTHNATLIVAKLDRLIRNVSFLSRLLDSGVEIVALDVPNLAAPASSKFVLQIMGAAAEHEAAMISARTKAALAARKRRGGKLGTTNQSKLRKAGTKARRAQADAHAESVYPVILELQKFGCDSIPKLIEGLRARGIKTLTDRTDVTGAPKWSYNSIKNIINRIESKTTHRR